jgi:8-oxo-dGTP pyrophosphatase MutT (NUDIX family)
MTDVAVHDGDGWTVCRHGHRHWGRFGAAGLLLRDDAEVILQHRAEWTHEGGAWGLPGGARDSHEDPVQAALREAAEEAGIPLDSARPTGYYIDDHGGWSYTTVIAHARGPVTPVALTRESTEIRWWPRALVPRLPLHSGLAAHWPALDASSDDVHLLVDAANVVGSRPDGWWRDRAGATTRLLGRLAQLARDGIVAAELPTTSAKLTRVLPRVTVVVEGAARAATVPDGATAGWWWPAVDVVPAPGVGDDTIVAEALRHPGTLVITADRGLRGRLPDTAAAIGPSWLWRQLETA